MAESISSLGLHSPLLWLLIATPVIVYIGNGLYNIFFHPLRHIPGPKINAFSRLPYIRHHLAGTIPFYYKQLHDKYGEVVRYSPNELSFISQETAWTDIYGFRTGKLKGQAHMSKDPMWYSPPSNGTPSLLLTNEADHTRERRVLAHAFSDKALSAQEVLLHRYGDQLVDRVRDAITASSAPVDLVKWYNWCTFDVISDLTFGEPFGCLRDMQTHRFVNLLLSSLQAAPFFYVMRHYPWTKWLGSLVVNQNLIRERREFARWVYGQTKARMERETDRADFMTYILQHNDGVKGMQEKEIMSNTVLFLVAGTETTATFLSGASYLLCQNPAAYAKLKAEVRSRWAAYGDITLESASHAPYLAAVLHESLRYFPPVPTGFNRVVPAGGQLVSGHYIPEGTSLCMSSHTAHHSARNFTDPDDFVPERWLGEPRYAHDKLEWVQPFSYGPRNCLGKNLAYAEMRLFLAKMVWSYDFELDPRSNDWMSNIRLRQLWSKPELLVKITPVARA